VKFEEYTMLCHFARPAAEALNLKGAGSRKRSRCGVSHTVLSL